MIALAVRNGRGRRGKASRIKLRKSQCPTRLIHRRQRGIAENRIGTTNVANGPEISKREAIEPLRFVAAGRSNGSQLKAPVADGQAAAVPVVGRLHACILNLMLHKVVAAIEREIETVASGLADLNEGLHLLALECRSGGAVAASFINGIQQGVADSQRSAAEAVAREEIVGSDLARLGVVVQVPLHAQVVDCLEPNAR